MGKRFARAFATLFAALFLALAIAVPAAADEGAVVFAVDAESLALDGLDSWDEAEGEFTLTYEGAALLADETQADVELLFSNVALDEAEAFASADVELAVVDAPEGALVALLVKQAPEEQPDDGADKQEEAVLLIGPAAGFALGLEFVDGEFLWSVAEDDADTNSDYGVQLPIPADAWRTGVSWVFGMVSGLLEEFGLPEADQKAIVTKLMDLDLEGLGHRLQDLDLEGLMVRLQGLDFKGLGLNIPSFSSDDDDLNLDDYEFDGFDFDGFDFDGLGFDDGGFGFDEWEDEPEITYYTVTFKDPDGRILDEQEIEYGGAATAPKIPRRVDETFLYWDRDFSYVTGNLVVRAVYVSTIPSTGDATAPLSALTALAVLGLAAICCPARFRTKYFAE